MIKKILLLLLTILSLLACKKPNKATKVTEKNAAKKIIPNIGIKELNNHFEKEEIGAILQIKNIFDKGLVDGKEVSDYTQAYKNHASRMRADYFNNFPYTLNYPYNDKFDLSQVKVETDKLSFLSQKCGFKDSKNDTIINYYCFKLGSNYMSFLESMGTQNGLIQFLADDYKKNKAISVVAKNEMLINSYESLNFENLNHQIIYLFFQVMVNEERLAANKL